MKRNTKLQLTAAALLAALVLTGQSLQAQTCDSTGVGQGNRGGTFMDANGDGFNDNAPDHDGDGIPNGQDPDYVRTGTGRGHGFVDADGDGINDYAQDTDGNGIPNGKDPDYVRLQDGSGRKMMRGSRGNGFATGQGGFGRGAGSRTGSCQATTDGSLRKGTGGRRGR